MGLTGEERSSLSLAGEHELSRKLLAVGLIQRSRRMLDGRPMELVLVQARAAPTRYRSFDARRVGQARGRYGLGRAGLGAGGSGAAVELLSKLYDHISESVYVVLGFIIARIRCGVSSKINIRQGASLGSQ